MNNKLVIALILVLVSCTKTAQDSGYYNQAPTSDTDILFENISLEPIELDSVLSSFGGTIDVTNDGLHFVDYNFGWIFDFDFNGALKGRRLGIGQGPTELPSSGITFYSLIPGGGHLFIGSSYDYYTFAQDLERQQTNRIRWIQDKPLDYLQQNPTPEDQRSYNLAYFITDVRATQTHALLPLVGGIPEYTNFDITTDLFAKEARILAKMNLESGEIEEIFGRYSPTYYHNPEKRPLSYFFFDLINDETIALTFAADSLIHLFSMDFDHIASFGVEGREMNNDYEEFPGGSASFESFMNNQMRNKGFYNSIKYIPETALLFRGYSKGTDSENDGMQIYKNNILIADFDVPKGVRIAGYVAPYYYSDADIDERNATMKVHRFTLNF